MSLFQELKRRNVFKVAVAYIVVSWVILQIVDTVGPGLGWPDWVMSFFIVLIGLGLPIALIFAWAFELTPEGIKREGEVYRGSSTTKQTGLKINFIIIGALVLAIGGLVWDRGENGDVAIEEGQVATKTIAVMPFVNMSSDLEQEFFSDGITEEILNALVRVKGLKVTARTSAFAYKGQSPDLREVGKALGVENILEGSVRKDGTKVRITAQLINTADGSHIWSEVYDRELIDIFAIQDEIATAIAQMLTQSLGVKEGQRLVEDRLTNMEAYEQYLRARRLIKSRNPDTMSQAHDLLKKVIVSEPGYAPAWAALSLSYHLIPFYGQKVLEDGTTNLMEVQYESEMAARRAVSLNPNLASAHHVLGNALRWRHEWVSAEDEYQKARELDPDSVEIIEDYGEFLEFVGKYEQSIQVSKLGMELDPSSPFPFLRYSRNLLIIREYDLLKELALPFFEKYPNANWVREIIIELYFHEGDFEKIPRYLYGYGRLGAYFTNSNEVIKAIVEGENLTSFKSIFYEPPEINYYLGGVDAVLKGLEQSAFNNPFYYLMPVTMNAPFMDEVRQTKRFKEIVVQLGLVDYWRERGWPDICHATSDYDFECGAFVRSKK